MRGLRVGIVNPSHPFSKRARELLQERGFPIIELKLFETRAGGQSTLTEFEGEIVVTQPLDVDLFPHLDLILFGGDDEEQFSEKANVAAKKGVLTIVSGVADVAAPVVAAGVNEESLSPGARLLVAARAPSILLGTVLAALNRSMEVEQARATILTPAADKGEEGIEELHQQIVKILNFQEPPKRIFPEQLAFNLLLHTGTNGSVQDAVAAEAAELAGIDGEVTAALVRVPIFHGYALSLWVRFTDNVEPEALTKALRTSKSLSLPRSGKRDRQIPSPVSVAESGKIHVGQIRRDGSIPGAYWLWVVADSMALDPALRAILLAENLLEISG